MKNTHKIILTICLVIFGLFSTGCGCQKEMYTVSFDTVGGSQVTSQIIEKGEKVAVPIAPTREGFVFSKWLLDGVEYDFNSEVTKDITLTASWATDSRKSFTVTFNSNGGSEVNSVVVREGDTLISPNAPTRDGYVFLGWFVGTVEYNFANPVTKNITLTAKWEIVKENEFVITFNTNGGSQVKAQKVVDGEKATKPVNPTKYGYKFIGWELNGETFDFTTAIKENVTLVAIWEKKTQYTVKFDTDGGNSINSVKVYENDKVKMPTEPTREGYEFVKWQLDGKDYDFSSKITKNITLVAVWKEKTKYTVKFDTDGGSSISDLEVYENETVVKPTNPTKDDHIFVKWQLDGKDYDFTSKVTKNITLVAVWEKLQENEYVVTFDTDGGSSIDNQKVVEGSVATKPTSPTKEGYNFVKWQLNGKDYDFTAKVTGDITLVAVWEKEVIKVSSVTLSETSLELEVGDVTKLSITINPTNATNKTAEWTSSDESIVTVDALGNVTAKAKGTATITVTVDGKTASCEVTVLEPITYSVEYDKIEESSMEQHRLYIKSSEGKRVPGVIEVTTINDDVIEVQVTENGSENVYIRTVIKSAKVKSVN